MLPRLSMSLRWPRRDVCAVLSTGPRATILKIMSMVEDFNLLQV